MVRIIKQIVEKIRRTLETPEAYARRIGVTIGKGCTIDTKNWPTEPYLITIGDYVGTVANC